MGVHVVVQRGEPEREATRAEVLEREVVGVWADAARDTIEVARGEGQGRSGVPGEGKDHLDGLAPVRGADLELMGGHAGATGCVHAGQQAAQQHRGEPRVHGGHGVDGPGGADQRDPLPFETPGANAEGLVEGVTGRPPPGGAGHAARKVGQPADEPTQLLGRRERVLEFVRHRLTGFGLVDRQLEQHAETLQGVAQIVGRDPEQLEQDLGLGGGVCGGGRGGVGHGTRPSKDALRALSRHASEPPEQRSGRGPASDTPPTTTRYPAPPVRNVRQHVNPLGLHFQAPRARPVQVPDPLPHDCPVEVELGCADAKFSFDLARHDPDRLVVGLEIREALVDRNAARARREGLANLVFGYVNLNVDLDRVFAAERVDRFHLLFPDPWFKRRHKKRRVVDPELCAVMARQLRPGGELHVATDIWDLALDAMDVLESPEIAPLGLANVAGSWSFLRENPYPCASKREQTTLGRGQRVWRMVYRKP